MFSEFDRLHAMLEQMDRLREALEDLKQNILPTNPALFAAMVEGPLEDLGRLHSELIQYAQELKPTERLPSAMVSQFSCPSFGKRKALTKNLLFGVIVLGGVIGLVAYYSYQKRLWEPESHRSEAHRRNDDEEPPENDVQAKQFNASVRIGGIDQAMIAKAVTFQEESCRQLDAQIQNLQKILDRTKSGTTPKDLAQVVLGYKNQAKSSKTDWRKFVRNQIADIERQRDEIVNNQTAVLPPLRLRGHINDFGVAQSSMMITNEATPTKFFGLAKVGVNEGDYETFVVEGWKFNSLRSQKIELPRDIAKSGRPESGGARVIDIKDLHSAIQGSLLSGPAGPEVRQIRLNGIARIASTTMVKNAWGTAIDGSRECKVIEFVCTEDELKQAVIAARDAAKKNAGKQ